MPRDTHEGRSGAVENNQNRRPGRGAPRRGFVAALRCSPAAGAPCGATRNGIGRPDGPNRSLAGPDRFAADEGAASAAVPCRRRGGRCVAAGPGPPHDGDERCAQASCCRRRRRRANSGGGGPVLHGRMTAAKARGPSRAPERRARSAGMPPPHSLPRLPRRRHAARAFASQAPAAQACRPRAPIPRGAVRPAFPAAAGAPLEARMCTGIAGFGSLRHKSGASGAGRDRRPEGRTAPWPFGRLASPRPCPPRHRRDNEVPARPRSAGAIPAQYESGPKSIARVQKGGTKELNTKHRGPAC